MLKLNTIILLTMFVCSLSSFSNDYNNENIVLENNKQIINNVNNKIFFDKNIHFTKSILRDAGIISKENSFLIKKDKKIEFEVNLENFKTNYSINEDLNTSSIDIFKIYPNGTKVLINKENYKFSQIDNSKYGIQKLVVSLGNFSKEIDIFIDYNLIDIDDYFMYSSIDLNLREGPGTNFNIIGNLKVNDEVLITHKVDDEWVKILFNDKEYFCSNKYLMKDKKLSLLESFNVEESLIIFDGYISNDKKEKCISMYKKIPKNILNKIREDDFKILVSSNPYYTDGHCGTFYAKDVFKTGDFSNKICVYAKSINAINIAFLHEVGHWVDNYLGRTEGWGKTINSRRKGVSSDTVWIDIYNEEVSKSGYPSWANFCPEEYFAESFWKILTNPTWVKNTLPKTFDYITNCINRV